MVCGFKCRKSNWNIGPLWIMLTLVFAIALGGNISSYVRSNMHQDWHYDFTIGVLTPILYTLHCSHCIGVNDHVVYHIPAIDHLLN